MSSLARWHGVVLPALCLGLFALAPEPPPDQVIDERTRFALASAANRYAYGVPIHIAVGLPTGQEVVLQTVGGPEVRLPIGSISKSITSAAALELLDERDLDSPVSSFCPSVTHGDAIAVRDLLLHSSGYADLLSVRGDRLDSKTLSALLDQSLQFEPGSRVVYSSTDYVLIADVLEARTRRSIADILSGIFKRVGMADSDTMSIPVSVPAGAASDNSRYSIVVTLPEFVATGGVRSTARDIVRFDKWLFSNTLLASRLEAIRKSLSETSSIIPGWFVTARRAGLSEYWHDGAFPGYTSVNVALPSEHVYLAIIAEGHVNTYLMAESILDELGL